VKLPFPARTLKRAIIATVGSLVLLLGIVLLALPGPGLLVILGGLSILAIEFQWARRWMVKGREQLAKIRRHK
jgi:tellurite resistance protein TerC